uniref:C-type lectin domain-containing protein n=1 Tax=Sparus aurata TaxID=8175 RepID=A0A671XL30_SPAAU
PAGCPLPVRSVSSFSYSPMTWTKAQAYCREAYTDLATIENAEEMNQLINTFPSTDDNYVWIGLYSTFDWRYSDEYNDTIRPGNDFCVLWDYHGKLWWDHQCSEKTTFICNYGK